MAGGYGQRWLGPLGARDDAMGGAAENLNVEALNGDGSMVTVFDDFNAVIPQETFGDAANWETSGWVLTDATAPTADTLGMNAVATVTSRFDSCIRINPGTGADHGGNMQLDKVNAALPATGAHTFPHIWIAEDGAGAAVLDNTVFVFACRVGLITNEAAGAWDGKMYIGWAAAGDTSVLVLSTGIIDIATEAGPHVGFSIRENGGIFGISQRTATTALAIGTNHVQIAANGSCDSTLANGVLTVGDPVWWDLAIRMNIKDMSDAANNGTTQFYCRRVPPTGPAAGSQTYTDPAQTLGPWRSTTTSGVSPVLTNQTPNHTVALVPTIEVANGPSNQSDVLIDWWAFGVSRFSRS